MRQMTTEKLFDEGKYMVIYIYPETVKLDERQFFLWNLEDMSTAKANTHCSYLSVTLVPFKGPKKSQPPLKVSILARGH
jgi:hypothetical protein